MSDAKRSLNLDEYFYPKAESRLGVEVEIVNCSKRQTAKSGLGDNAPGDFYTLTLEEKDDPRYFGTLKGVRYTKIIFDNAYPKLFGKLAKAVTDEDSVKKFVDSKPTLKVNIHTVTTKVPFWKQYWDVKEGVLKNAVDQDGNKVPGSSMTAVCMIDEDVTTELRRRIRRTDWIDTPVIAPEGESITFG